MAEASDKRSYESLLYDLCRLFLDGKNAKEISEQLTDEYPWSVTREGVYPRLREARRYFKLIPPMVDSVRDAICEEFGLNSGSIHVVDAYRDLGDPIAEAGADLACVLIAELQEHRRDPVHLGFGPGSATRLLAYNLGQQLLAESAPPDLVLHAITAGCLSEAAHYSPLSFFNFFDQNLVQKAYGFFTDVVVPAERYPNVKERPGFAQAFEHRDEIDIIFTGLGETSHAHDAYRMMIEASDRKALKSLEDQGMVGNVQYRPYSEKGILEEPPTSARVSTLFELEDLRSWAEKKDKHVVLLVSPCSQCQERKTRALLPLLTRPELRVWSSIVLDVATGREVLAAHRDGKRPARNRKSSKRQG